MAICSKCGNYMPDDAAVCTVCGYRKPYEEQGETHSYTYSYGADNGNDEAGHGYYNQYGQQTYDNTPPSILWYIGMTVLFSLPVIGLIAAFVTVFAVGSNRAKRNFAIANLILRGIGFILGIIAWAGFLGVISRLPWGEWWYEYGGSITAMIDAVKAVI